MEVTNKQQLILNMLILGMEFTKSCYVAECTEEEIENLTNDATFQRRVAIELALCEKSLLEDHKRASDIAVEKGNASPIQWKLSKINPARWGTKQAEGDTDPPNPIGFGTEGVD